MKDLVSYLINSICEEKKAISIEESQEGDTAIIQILVSDKDIGRVIGKTGRTIKAIRLLAAAAFPGTRFLIKVNSHSENLPV